MRFLSPPPPLDLFDFLHSPSDLHDFFHHPSPHKISLTPPPVNIAFYMQALFIASRHNGQITVKKKIALMFDL